MICMSYLAEHVKLVYSSKIVTFGITNLLGSCLVKVCCMMPILSLCLVVPFFFPLRWISRSYSVQYSMFSKVTPLLQNAACNPITSLKIENITWIVQLNTKFILRVSDNFFIIFLDIELELSTAPAIVTFVECPSEFIFYVISVSWLSSICNKLRTYTWSS